jgi:flagellar export protein FliJ
MMAKFVFQLEAVLTQRRAFERERQRALAVVERERVRLEGELSAVQARIDAERGELRTGLAGGGSGTVDVRGVRYQAQHSLGLFARARQLVLQISGVHAQLEARRRELLEAATARKAVELLREKRLEEWKQERARRETAMLDDMNVMRAGRADDWMTEDAA